MVIWLNGLGRRIAGIRSRSPHAILTRWHRRYWGRTLGRHINGNRIIGVSFPWPHDGYPLCWFCPNPRAILNLDAVHVPKSLAKEKKKQRFRFTIDQAFSSVIAQCQQTKRPDQDSTWITSEMQSAYIALHQAGIAHSVEAWNSENELVGGLYGVDSGGVFTGESMFYREPYASKLCLLFLFDHLQARGANWIDIQIMTEHFQQLGAVEIAA